MSEKELVDMILSERIDQLLEQERDAGNNQGTDQEDQLLRGLEEKKRAQIEAYIDQLIEISAKHERHIYLGGFRDGVQMVLRICGIGRQKLFGEV